MYLAKLWRHDSKRAYLLLVKENGRCDAYNIPDKLVYYDLSVSTFEDLIPWGIPIVGV